MAQEIAIHGYYKNVYDSNFISTNMCVKLGMEFFLSALLFKGDLSRVVYSKEDIAFRRRVETLGAGDTKHDEYNYINLGLPFAIYSQTGSYEEDDRGSTQNAGQIVLGQMQPDSGIVIKSAAVKTKYSATLFFARRDDVNVASQLLYWEKTPKFPVYYIVQHELAGLPIDIPVFITLDSFNSDTEYQEKQWLEKSKIFPIKCEFTVRSYQTLIEDVDHVIKLPIRFSGLYAYNDEGVVFTQKTSLIWADSKWTVDQMPKQVEYDSQGSEIITPDKYDPNWVKPEKVVPLESLEENGKLLIKPMVDHETNDIIADAVQGYFSEERDCILDEFHQVDTTTTENEIGIEWKIKDTDIPHFHSIMLYIPGLYREERLDVNDTSFVFKGLYPGSEYDCTLIITSKTYSKLTYKLKLKTKGEPVLGKTLLSKYVGKVFTQTEYDYKGGPI